MLLFDGGLAGHSHRRICSLAPQGPEILELKGEQMHVSVEKKRMVLEFGEAVILLLLLRSVGAWGGSKRSVKQEGMERGSLRTHISHKPNLTYLTLLPGPRPPQKTG